MPCDLETGHWAPFLPASWRGLSGSSGAARPDATLLMHVSLSSRTLHAWLGRSAWLAPVCGHSCNLLTISMMLLCILFYTDGKTRLSERGHVTGPRSSLDLGPSNLFTTWGCTCRSQLLCLGGGLWFTKLSPNHWLVGDFPDSVSMGKKERLWHLLFSRSHDGGGRPVHSWCCACVTGCWSHGMWRKAVDVFVLLKTLARDLGSPLPLLLMPSALGASQLPQPLRWKQDPSTQGHGRTACKPR